MSRAAHATPGAAPAACRRCHRWPVLLAFAVALAAHVHGVAAQRPDALADPFADIVQRRLPNGLTVWIRPLPGARTTSISLAVPYGSDRDPAGREELAHVVEHALFAADEAQTEEQITREIADRGGSFNASTSPDRTLLWVTVAGEHGPFALEWLYHRVQPRTWDESLMPGLRDAVALELGIGPRSLLDYLRDRYFLHPGLLPPGLWTREFGLRPPEYRRADIYASLQRIRAGDVLRFYQQYYTPVAMSLLIAGDVDSTLVLRDVERTFGELPVWTVQPPPPAPARLKRTATRRFFWNLRDDVRLSLSFRLDSLSADDDVRLLFAQQLLEHRLTRRLRWGEQQVVYGIGSAIVRRGDVALLTFEARVQPQAWPLARSIIEDELQRLRHGRYPPGEFEQDRATLDRRLRLSAGTPAALRGWHASTFYRADRTPVPPPLATRFATLAPAELATFARRQLGPEREIRSVERPLPLGQGAAALLPLFGVLLGVGLARRLLLRPIALPRIRYLARIRPPLLLSLVAGALLATLLLGGLRLLAAGAHHLAAALLWPRESFVLQVAGFVLAVALAAFSTLLVLALVPRKVLVLEHEARIKFAAYRSRVLRPEDIREVRLAHWREVFLERRAWRTVPLAFGLRRPGVLLRTAHGLDWFIGSRNPGELVRALEQLRLRRRVRRDVWLAAAGAAE